MDRKKNTQWGGLELVPARSHKPNDVGSNPTPATNDYNLGRATFCHDYIKS